MISPNSGSSMGRKNEEIFMKYAISTQYMENYGAHSESGKAFWKMKGGDTYIVSGLNRYQDAIAYVVGEYSENNSDHYREFVTSWQTEEEWHELITHDEIDSEYSDYLKSTAVHCNATESDS